MEKTETNGFEVGVVAAVRVAPGLMIWAKTGPYTYHDDPALAITVTDGQLIDLYSAERDDPADRITRAARAAGFAGQLVKVPMKALKAHGVRVVCLN